MNYVKAVLSLFQIIFYVIGIFSVDTHISYGGTPYTSPQMTAPMCITQNGASDYVIVMPENADECLQTSAAELKDYIEKLSGAVLPVTEESAYDGGSAILLGGCALAAQLAPVDSEAAGADGFRLFSDGSRLVISGASSRGTLYGVYTLLEEYFGVRWFTPTLEVVPHNDTLQVDSALDRTVAPSFAVRRNDCPGTNDAYRARTKMNVSFWNEMPEYGGALTYVLWDVTLDTLVPDALFEQHPDYFALLSDGTRSTDHVCLSNPAVLPIAVANAKQAILSCERNANYIHIGQKDNSNYCRCEKCTALYEKYGSVSAPTILFTNAFADALDDEFPGFIFTFYAYGETDRPPKDLSLRCSANVAPVLCGLHKACRSHPLTACGAQDNDESFLNLFGENEPVIAMDFADWVKVADTTYIYDYTINFLNSAQFFSNFETMQPTMEYMHDLGIAGYIYNCGDGHEAAFNELRNYLLHKLQWDVHCDVAYHMTDFLNHYYGEAATPYIKEILDIQTAQIKATAHAFDFDWHYQSGFYSPLNIIRLDSLWRKALSADITEEQLFRVETANLSWEYFKANQFIGKYFFLNPGRLQANEELYDAFKAHGINRVSSFGLIPEKDDVDFMLRPFNWK